MIEFYVLFAAFVVLAACYIYVLRAYATVKESLNRSQKQLKALVNTFEDELKRLNVYEDIKKDIKKLENQLNKKDNGEKNE